MREIGALCIRLQCLALPVHSWVAVVNMLCAGLGNAKGALLLSTSRQGTCFLPIVYPMTYLWGAVGAASVQAAADILSLALALPLIRSVKDRYCRRLSGSTSRRRWPISSRRRASRATLVLSTA